MHNSFDVKRILMFERMIHAKIVIIFIQYSKRVLKMSLNYTHLHCRNEFMDMLRKKLDKLIFKKEQQSLLLINNIIMIKRKFLIALF